MSDKTAPNDMPADRQVDWQLVQRTLAGDQKAFELLVLKYQKRIERLVARMVRDVDAVPDITQETFIRAYRALHQFRGDAQFYTWLYRIGINTAKNYLSASGKRPLLSGDYEDEDGDTVDLSAQVPDLNTPETEYMNRQIVETVNRAVDALPEELRMAITLREMEGMSYEDIALAMDCPIGTVRSRIFRAREAISAQLKPLLDTAKNKRW